MGELKNTLKYLAMAVHQIIQEEDKNASFALLTFHTSEPEETEVRSNADRVQLIKALRNTADRLEIIHNKTHNK